jgi:hypothetical protein
MERHTELTRFTPLRRTAGLTPGGPPERRTPLKASRRDTGPSDATREVVLARDKRLCVRHGGFVAHPHIHHRKRRSQGGQHTPENLITLCPACHEWVHTNVAEAQAAGWLVKGSEDPALISVLVISEHRSGLSMWATPDGRWSENEPDGCAA